MLHLAAKLKKYPPQSKKSAKQRRVRRSTPSSVSRIDDRVGQCLESEGALVNQAAADGFPPFALAVFFGQPDVYRYLLQHGADVNQPALNPMRVTAVHAAVARHDADGLALILAHDGDPNARQKGGWTGLHSAAAHGDRHMTEMLLEAGADRQARTEKGETAADLARSGGHSELALWLEALGLEA